MRNSTNQVAATITNIAKKIGLFVKSWSPTTGMSESKGIEIADVLTPVEMSRGTMTCERRKLVVPSASRLITTPEMIWSTRKVTDTTEWSAPISPPVSTAARMPIHSQNGSCASPSDGVDGEADPRGAEHHALDARC